MVATRFLPWRLLRVVVWGGLVIASGCGGSPPPSSPPAATAAPLVEAGLAAYAPAAGIQWAVAARPRELFAHPELGSSLRRLLPDERLERFATSTGVDLRKVEEGLIASYPLGTLYLVRDRGTERSTLAHFVDLLPRDAERRSPHPHLHVASGVKGGVPWSALAADDRFVAFAEGDPTLLEATEAFVRGKLRQSPAVLEGAALGDLPKSPAPLVAYLAGPVPAPWEPGLRGLLGETLAARLALTPTRGAVLDCDLRLLGDYGTDGSPRLEESWTDLVRSPLGHLLGLDRPITLPRLRADTAGLWLNVGLDSDQLGEGLHAAVSAEVEQLLRLGDGRPGAAPAAPAPPRPSPSATPRASVP